MIASLSTQKHSGNDGARPRIFWCPTGAFSTLPLHAAGTTTQGKDLCSDYVVSSYIPTLCALMHARTRARPLLRDHARPLVVAESSAPGMPHLFNVIEEVEAVAQVLSFASPAILGDGGSRGSGIDSTVTNANVIEKLPGASILHLACHGQQDMRNPLESGFEVCDGRLTVSALMHLNIPEAFFAFLSACETAKGDAGLPDQAVHLAATMLFVGFPSVIGTMW